MLEKVPLKKHILSELESLIHKEKNLRGKLLGVEMKAR